MRYLRSFNESVNKNYRSVEYDEYFHKVDNITPDKMRQFEIDAVNQIVLPSRTNRDPFFNTDSNYCYLIPGDLVIYRNEDDWFFVNLMTIYGNNFYECDQLEGLLQLLRDEYRRDCFDFIISLI